MVTSGYCARKEKEKHIKQEKRSPYRDQEYSPLLRVTN